MNKIKLIFLFVVFSLFIPRVYALSFDLDIPNEVLVEKNYKMDVMVSLRDIKDTDEGVLVCTMNILFDKNIELESPIRTVNNWSMTTGGKYLFNAEKPIFDLSDIFIIPIVVHGSGKIELNNIECSDTDETVKINNKMIKFIVDGDEEELLNSPSCNLLDIELSEGMIEFDPDVTEYEIKVNNFNDLIVIPELEDKNASYTIEKNISESKSNIVITVNDTNGNFKKYILYSEGYNNENINNEKNNYIIIFIIIIIVLVLINVIRIIRNIIKNKGQKK